MAPATRRAVCVCFLKKGLRGVVGGESLVNSFLQWKTGVSSLEGEEAGKPLWPGMYVLVACTHLHIVAISARMKAGKVDGFEEMELRLTTIKFLKKWYFYIWYYNTILTFPSCICWAMVTATMVMATMVAEKNIWRHGGGGRGEGEAGWRGLGREEKEYSGKRFSFAF